MGATQSVDGSGRRLNNSTQDREDAVTVRSSDTHHQNICTFTPASGVSKDVLPGPYPKTPEERAAAAKKYNMTVEDYQPYPDDGRGYGDYPMLPNRSQQERDPWYNWDHPDLRRNWGEPRHQSTGTLICSSGTEWTRPRVQLTGSTMSKTLLGYLGFMLLMFGLGEVFPAYQPVAPKQFPYNDLYLERGGDPEQEPEPVKHYEI
ncbi:hypothetical protein MHYP_G00167670 [Metynnis hypsauchen]